MRLLFSIIISFFVTVGFAQKQADLIVSGDYSNHTIKSVLQDLSERYPISFYYKSEWLPEATVQATFQEEKLSTALTEILQANNLFFSFYSDYAIIVTKEPMEEQNFSRAFFEARSNLGKSSSNQTTTLVVGDSTRLNSSGQAKVELSLENANNQEVITGALVYIESLGLSEISDGDGKVTINIPLGRYNLGVQSIGYTTLDQSISVFNDGELRLLLQDQAYNLGEVVIEERRNDDNVKSVTIGVESLSAKEIRELPSFLGEADVVKSLLTLPGVSTVGEGATGFNVRGGNIDQNLILQDGAPVFNASHALGFYSIFNPDAVSQVKLYKGYIPAFYGGRLSSVLDVRLKDGDYDRFGFSGGIGPIAGRITVNGPIVKGKTAYLVSGRSSYANWILKRAENPDVNNSRASFYDFNIKLNQRIGKASSIIASYYQSSDDFQFSDQYGFNWATKIAALEWNQIITPNLSSGFSISAGQLLNNFFDPLGTDAFTLENGLRYYKAKQNFFLTPGGEHNIHFGVEATQYESEPEVLRPRGDISTISPALADKGIGREIGIYVNDEFVLNQKLSLAVGLRYSFYQQLGPGQVFEYEPGKPLRPEHVLDSILVQNGEVIQRYSGFEPRLSFRYIAGKNSSLKLSYNRLLQYIHLISNSTAATPADIWQVSTRYIPPQLSNNFSIGYYRNFNNNSWESSVELYYKGIPQLVEYKDFANLLINENLETELLIGRGRAYGFELALKRRTGKLTGSMSYTFSRSLRQVEGPSEEESINSGAWFPSNFDKPHNLNLNLKLKTSKRGLLSIFFNYSTGRPVTIPTANYFQSSIVLPHYSDRNQFRIPDYHRMDIAYTINRKAVRKSRYKGSLTISVYNVYFRRNAFSVFFRKDPEKAFNAFRLAVLGTAFPAVTYNFKF